MIQDKLKEIEQFLKSKGFKQKSVKTSSSILKKVFERISEDFNEQEAEDLLTKLNLKPRGYNLYRTVINFYTKKYKGYKISFTKAKVDKTFPTIVAYDEFKKVISVIQNVKHKLGLAIIYGCGLRPYEVCRLQKHHIYFDKRVILIKKGKGGKDRYTILPLKTANSLELFIKTTDKDNPYVFQTYRGHISERSFQEVLRRAIKKSGINKHFTLHDLRHNFAVNLVNKGVDIEIIRRLLGHSSLRTTQIYLKCRLIDLTNLAIHLDGNLTQCVK